MYAHVISGIIMYVPRSQQYLHRGEFWDDTLSTTEGEGDVCQSSFQLK